MSGPEVAPPAVAEEVFGERLALASRFADRLAAEGVQWGLLGPREIPRLWDRHLLNCAVVTDLLPEGARVVDVGSGAGLPGLVFACRRSDLRIDLVESLQRRVNFLAETVELLGLGDRVRVIHGRAEDAAVRSQVAPADWVTARAVAPLDRLVRWCLPLLAAGGSLLAMKGERADDEVAEHRDMIRRAGGDSPKIVQCGTELLDPPATVVVVRKAEASTKKRGRRRP